MEAYLIGVLMSFSSFGAVGFVLLMISFLPQVIFKEFGSYSADHEVSVKVNRVSRYIRLIAGLVVVAGLVVSVFSPTNTYKHESHNKVQLNQTIQNQNMNPSTSAQIIDNTRQPKLDDEARAERFNDLIDYKK